MEIKMKIAVSAKEKNLDSMVDSRFGRAQYFIVYDVESGCFDVLDNNQNLFAEQGAGIQSASTIVNSGCKVLICKHCGPKAFSVLSKAGVSVYSFEEGTVRQAIDAFKKDELKKLEAADSEGHW